MTGKTRHILLWFVVIAAGSCVPGFPPISTLPVGTRFAFTNLSTRFYAALAMRVHGDDASASYALSPLLAPGATFRGDFSEFIDTVCPDSLDFRIFLYRRVNEDIPIGLDETEAVESSPIVAGEVLDVPACSIDLVEVYTIVNWDADEGIARVKFAQDTGIDAEIRRANFFGNNEAVWKVVGVDDDLALQEPPALASMESIAGSVTLADGTGVENIGVLVRTYWRQRLDDGNTENDPDAGWSDPIAVTKTDATGAFSINRPAGVYRVEVFADGYLFRPTVVDVETPLEQITILAEPQ